MDDTQRDALLLSMSRDIRYVRQKLDGNGQPGLIRDVAGLQADVETLKQANSPTGMSKKERAATWTGVLTALLTALAAAFGRDVLK